MAPGLLRALRHRGHPSALESLNDIVHPRLLRILKADILKQKRQGAPLVVVDVALIFEWGIANWCDYILVVTAKRDVRMEHLIKSGLSHREAVDISTAYKKLNSR